MPEKEKITARTTRAFRSFEAFVREYTHGLETKEFRRLFDREATEAFDVLTRDQPVEKGGGLGGFFRRAKIVFLGLSYKLTPARRLLFASAMIFALFGAFNPQFDWRQGSGHLSVQFHPLFFVLSIAALTFLLALELVDRVRVRDELEVARDLQRALLPATTPKIPGFTVADAYRTANAVGGDYYDVLDLEDGRHALVVGDASGHGIAAGLLMAIVHATLRTAVDLDPDPKAVLRVVNRTLCRTAGRRAFMSLFYGLLEPASGKLVYACAGHPFPLLRRVDGSILELGEGGLPLGLRESLESPQGQVTLAPDDLILLYSDGMPEALNSAGESFGFDRVRESVGEGGSPAVVRERLLAQLGRFLGDEALGDDLSLLVLARTATAPVDSRGLLPLPGSSVPSEPAS